MCTELASSLQALHCLLERVAAAEVSVWHV